MERAFVYGMSVEGENFTDRVKETKRLKMNFENGINVILVSPRRMGKSSIVKKVKSEIETTTLRVVYMDIYDCRSEYEFYNRFASAIMKETATRSEQLLENIKRFLIRLTPKISFSPEPMSEVSLSLGITPQNYQPEEILQLPELIAKEQGLHIVVCIDEFQQIVNYPERNIEALLRTHIQHCSQASFIFSGSERHIMGEIFLDTARPFYNSADMMMLKPIAEDKYLEFVNRHFTVNGKTVDDEAVHKAYQTFEGNTYYLQKTFRTAFAETGLAEHAGCQQIEEIIRQMTADNSYRYSDVLSRLNLAQKELLYAIAKEGQARQITSGAFIRRHHLQSASSVQAASKKLITYGLLSTENGAYYVDDQLMRLWLLN